VLGDERELRRLRLEARANLEEAEACVGEVAAASRTMTDILGDLGLLSVPLAVDVPGRQIHGVIVHVGAEAVRLETPGAEAFDIAVAAIAGVRSSGESRGVVQISNGHPATMLARLRELSTTSERVTMGRYFASELVGTVLVAGVNHVQLEDNQSKMWFVPASSVAWVGPPF
jgi:hypothetical protein